MEFLNRYQEIVAKAIQKHTFKNKPSELYEPMNYIISHGGKRLRPIMVLMATEPVSYTHLDVYKRQS